MQMVINIPDKYMKGKKVENGSLACEYILEAVYNGTPLPKGHGKLKDVDAISLDDINFFSINDYLKMVHKLTAEVGTIIEADKEQNNANNS